MSDSHAPASAGPSKEAEPAKDAEAAAPAPIEARPPGEPTEKPAAEPPAAPTLSPRREPNAVIWLAGLLGIVIIGILAAPFWAPAMSSLLPWGDAAPRADETKLAALSARLDRLEPLAARLDKLEAQSSRLDRLETARNQEQQAVAASTAAMQQLDRRIAALEARPAAPFDAIAELRQQSTKIGSTVADLASRSDNLTNRLDALEKSVKAQAASDATDTATSLLLLQIREALDTGRPFAAEYDALAALARARPDIAAAAAPLADAARTGIASRAVLIARFDELAGAMATAQAPPAESDWQGQILTRLGSLVTIRRVAGPGQSGPESTVSEARKLLAQGDLARAVGVIEKLDGANAEVARPWLDMARTRLAAETALKKTEALVSARLATARDAIQATGRP